MKTTGTIESIKIDGVEMAHECGAFIDTSTLDVKREPRIGACSFELKVAHFSPEFERFARDACEKAARDLAKFMDDAIFEIVGAHMDLGGDLEECFVRNERGAIPELRRSIVLVGDREIARVVARCDPDVFNVRVIVEWA